MFYGSLILNAPTRANIEDEVEICYNTKYEIFSNWNGFCRYGNRMVGVCPACGSSRLAAGRERRHGDRDERGVYGMGTGAARIQVRS